MRITLEDINREMEEYNDETMQGEFDLKKFFLTVDESIHRSLYMDDRRVLVDLYDMKHLVNRRMEFLQKKINDIRTYLTEAGVKKGIKDHKKNFLILLVFVIIMFLLYAAFPEALMPALVGIILFFFLKYGRDTEGLYEKNKDWEEKLEEMLKEYEELTDRKERLIERIEVMEKDRLETE